MTKRTLMAVAVISLSATLWLGCGHTSGDEKNNVSEEQQETTSPARPNAAQLNTAVLRDEWQVDTDQNGIPDFIEKESGYNPAGEDCNPEAACGEGIPGADLDLSVNTLLMLDVSGSMAARLGGVPKIEIAKMSLLKYASSVPESIRLGLLVYGHQGNNEQSGKAESCAGIEVMAPIGNLSEANANTIINRFSPTGWTPIASALEKAKQTFGTDRKGRNRIIMVSDGVETCGGDPVSVARQLHSSGFAVTIDVVGFNVPGSDAQQLKRIAEAGGGIYFDARTQSALDAYFQEQNRAAAKTWEAANCYAEAYNKAWLCDANMVLKAVRVLNAESRKAQSAGKNDEVRALEAVRLAINQKHEERKKQRKIIKEKWHKLSRDAFEINQKTLKAYGKMRRSS